MCAILCTIYRHYTFARAHGKVRKVGMLLCGIVKIALYEIGNWVICPAHYLQALNCGLVVCSVVSWASHLNCQGETSEQKQCQECLQRTIVAAKSKNS